MSGGIFNFIDGIIMAKDKFGSRIGLLAATVGSAVGLGNIWRFPAETQANGGAAFLLLYLICVFVLGIPLMLAEFSLGRGTDTDAVGAFRKLRPGSAWWLTGALGVLSSYLILCFYMVVAGWTLEYLWQSITGNLYAGISDAGSMAVVDGSFHHKMENYICGDVAPLIVTYIVIIINIGVLIGGVQKGIERFSSWLMPVLFLLLLVFSVVSLSMPGASKGVSFFLTPDFSKITGSTIISALGQAFFSLSLGLGCLITYGSYFPRSTKLTQTAVTVSLLDILVAVLMGLTIFPAVASFGLDNAELRGSTLVFVTLPEIFAQMPGTQIWSILFFFLLLVAAVTSTISLGEVSISFVCDRFGKSRKTATFIVMMPLFLLSSLCSLSFGYLSDWKIGGYTIFNFLDMITTNYMLPVGAFFICVFMGWFAPKGFFRKELVPSMGRDRWLYGAVEFIVRYIAPALILMILISGL